jgi:hypothetical protein
MQIAGTSVDSLAFWRPEQSFEKARDVAASIAASAIRGWSGGSVGALGARPEQRLVLFEKEACPYSRLVREAMSILDLDCEMKPCPDGEGVHRAELSALSGKEQVPFLVDPSKGTALSESSEIIAYLFATYGAGPVPPTLRGPLAIKTSQIASKLRGHRGNEKEPARRPALPLELYGYEAGAHTRIVREALSSMGLPWICQNRAQHSPRRFALEAELGPLAFPYLRDPNTGRSHRESDVIVGYLTATYGRHYERMSA